MFQFPNPNEMFIEGDFVRKLSFLFVSPDENVGIAEENLTFGQKYVNLKSFSYPSLPDPFPNLHPDGEDAVETITAPTPNRNCPKWLHDVYITKNHWEAHTTSDEPTYWRTWHPSIDPIYWCYFDHEHGSWPGRHYNPMFGYVAWKVLDPSSPTGRQLESHNGFKVFYLPLIDDRIAIFTVHMHTSRARRFTARHHTIVLAVLRGAEVEVEVSFKSDFGPGQGHARAGPPQGQPLDDTQWAVYNDVRAQDRLAFRTFNVINIDDNFPDSLDDNFLVKGDVSKGRSAILNGFYEAWTTTLPSCTSPASKYDGDFRFDIRRPSTAARFATGNTDENLQWMNGRSVERTVVINGPSIVFSVMKCSSTLQESHGASPHGVFFTNPYFESTHSSPGTSTVRQFIKKSFEDLTFERGFRRAGDPWSGWYGINGSPGLQAIEKAPFASVN